MWNRRCTAALVLFSSLSAAGTVLHFLPNLQHFRDGAGAVATYSTRGDIDQTGAFFQALGTNGRTCASCHQADQAFSISAKGVRQLYERTHGEDPLFAAVDGANCPTADTKERANHSLLLERGLIRVGITLPAHPQFQLAVVHDPYGCALTLDPKTGATVASVYRRPIPSSNLRYLSAVMFDGRETLLPLNTAETFQNNLMTDLTDQALTAVQTHAEGKADPTPEQLSEIVQFELSLSTAQVRDDGAGSLHGHGATGGPLAVAAQSYYPGANDALGGDPKGAAFTPNAFSLYTAWEDGGSREADEDRSRAVARREIAAGEKIFNSKPAIITGVRGLNDSAALGSPAKIVGTCTTCHDSPNVGNHSVALPLDIATSRLAGYESDSAIVAGLNELSAPDLPVYEVRGCPDPAHAGGTVNFYTTDPGKGLVTGQCADVNRGKGPILRGLAARAPFFHNGAARDLDELVNFYNERFQMNLTRPERRQLVAFLNSL